MPLVAFIANLLLVYLFSREVVLLQSRGAQNGNDRYGTLWTAGQKVRLFFNRLEPVTL